MKNCIVDPYLPRAAQVISYEQKSRDIFMLNLSFVERHYHYTYTFSPGQFNMVYLFGVGEIAISIISDPSEKNSLDHIIRAIGRVTNALKKVQVGDELGIRGPFGRGWPLHKVQGKDIVIITGGLGCAPTVSIINYILARRNQYGKLTILQGVKHSQDFIFRKHYEIWEKAPNTKVYIAADEAGPKWPWGVGYITDMVDRIDLCSEQTVVMMCGPEMMMRTAIKVLSARGINEKNIFLSMERNMECGIGHCGHCQYGGLFICKDGPVFSYPEIKSLFNVQGY